MVMDNHRVLYVYLTAVITIAVLFSAPTAADDDPPGLVRKDCFNWYTEGIKIVLWKAGQKIQPLTFEEGELKPKSEPKVVCSDKLTNGIRTNVLQLSYKNAEGQTLDLDWSFDIRADGDWFLNERKSKIDIREIPGDTTPSRTFKFKDAGIEAANKFSYSCSSLSVRNDNSTRDVPYLMDLRIRRFQVQPFSFPSGKKLVFADSFDCSTWFTIPLWVGLLVTLLFTAILATGVYALMGIKTPDRFENPKGKTITVTTTD